MIITDAVPGMPEISYAKDTGISAYNIGERLKTAAQNEKNTTELGKLKDAFLAGQACKITIELRIDQKVVDTADWAVQALAP